MAGSALTTASVLQCPHGGTVAIVSSNARVSAAGAPLALATDTFTITGCPFQIPVGVGTVPSPCVKVQWIVSDLRDGVGGMATLSSSSVGLCLAATQMPQGNVVISTVQPTVSSQ
jgi:hypothetical protein